MSNANQETQKHLVILDAHALLHRAYHALPDFTSDTGEPTGALYGFVTMVLKMARELRPDFVFAAFDLPEPTHRHEAFEAYKATRSAPDDALISQLNRARDLCRALAIPVLEAPGFEADDLIGTVCARSEAHHNLHITIVSGDMDTLQLIADPRVAVYTLKKGIKETILYDEKGVEDRYGFGAKRIPDYKGLSGDPSDNIPGVPGIGEKTATALIQAFGSLEDIYRALEKEPEAFAKAGIKPRVVNLLSEHRDEAFFSKELATIRTDAPYQAPSLAASWRESVDTEALAAFFRELGFRSLLPRISEAFGGHAPPSATAGASDTPEKNTEEPSADERKLALLALWLVRSDYTNPSLEDLYTHTGTEHFSEAQERIFEELRREALVPVFDEIERPLVPVLRAMEARGILIDRSELARLAESNRTDLSALEKKIHDAAGAPFNINSPKQLGEVLFDTLGLTAKGLKKTEGGARSTRESELEKLREAHPIVGLVLEYREIQKLLSTYLEVLPTLADEEGRVHTHFIQTGTTTGRMASQNPNLQNIPIRTERGRAVRAAFIARPGFSLASCDYSQIELRIAAFLSGDEKLVAAFQDGGDVHRLVAAELFGVPEHEVNAEMRRRAKAINFGILYGMGANALAVAGGMTRAEAQDFLAEYAKKFPDLRRFLERVKTEAVATGATRTFFGRKRSFDGMRSPLPYVRAQAERMAVNAPIQGTSADIIKLAMVRIAAFLEKEGRSAEDAAMVLQVHDELVFEIRDDLIPTLVPKLVSLMEGVIEPERISGVHLAVDAKVGKNWGTLETGY